MGAKDQPGAAASGEDPAAEAGEPVGASAAYEALSAKAMAMQLFDYLLGTFQAALFPDVLSDLGDVLVARGRRSVVLPGGHRAGPPGPLVRGGPALQPYRRGHIEDARDRTGRPRRLQAGLMQPGFAHTTNRSLLRPINLALPSLFSQNEVEWHRLLLKYSRRGGPGAYWRGGLGSQGLPLDADGNPDSAGVRHGALARGPGGPPLCASHRQKGRGPSPGRRRHMARGRRGQRVDAGVAGRGVRDTRGAGPGDLHTDGQVDSSPELAQLNWEQRAASAKLEVQIAAESMRLAGRHLEGQL